MFRKTLAFVALILVTSCANMGGGMSCCGNGGCCSKMMEMQKADQKSGDGKAGCCCSGMMGKGMQCKFPEQTKTK